ncbi:hypothetical protein LSUE1_G004800 [Lachnellula suecica]|uniref:DUF1996 domain-containing protein n=1 Tax=Lachnellula suecica TaxID=602035 RepID=A0A8T9BXT7_9HELO|nr:hypothetical protein LSUE1_G004800 [Lachnellula suecica]
MLLITLFLGAVARGARAYTIVEADLLSMYIPPVHHLMSVTSALKTPRYAGSIQELFTFILRYRRSNGEYKHFGGAAVGLHNSIKSQRSLILLGPHTLLRRRHNIHPRPLQPIQRLLRTDRRRRIVIGNSDTTSQADIAAGSGVTWFCEGEAAEDKDDAAFPSSTCSTHLQTLLYFHDCVTEDTLESTYSSASNTASNRCPSDMKRMPRLRFSIRYDLRKILPDGWSGTAPLEWLAKAATNMLNATAKRDFQEVTGTLGGDSESAVCQDPADAEPVKETNDYKTSLTMMAKQALGRFDRR